jgi:hypothetical protein
MTMAMTAIYSFKKFNYLTGKTEISLVKGTLAAIEFAQAKPIFESKEMVEASELDGDGFHRTNSN